MNSLDIDGVRVIESVRHDRKLRRGALAWNEFAITVRDLQDPGGLLDQRLQAVEARGFPNFFGPQRFGHDRRNLQLAERWFAGTATLKRDQRSMALSAARAAIFNAVLERRLADGSWDQAMAGDALMLDGRGSFFVCESPDDDIARRLAASELHVTGPLWGSGEPPVLGTAAVIEKAVADAQHDLAAGLEANRLRQERRALRVMPRSLEWEIGDELLLRCRLPPGVFATSLLAAVMTVRDAAEKRGR